MPINQRGEVGAITELKSVTDSDGQGARPASDERLESIRQQGENPGGLGGFEYTTESTNAEQLPEYDVPDGIAVLLDAPPENSGRIYVGPEDVQPAGLDPGGSITLRVARTTAIWVRATNAGDSIGALYEQ
jgi:hypothetical protein